MSLIASAVKLAPLQTSGELISNVQDSPTKHIDAKLKGSVTRLVLKERKNITKIQLEGVTIDNTIGSLAALSETLWFGTAVKAHTQGQCLDLHKVFISATCTCIRGLREHETVACCLNSPPYKEQKELPISYALGDNSSSFQKFVTEELELDANVCQTHATAIAKHNGIHRTYFDSNENYEVFYDFVCAAYSDVHSRTLDCDFKNYLCCGLGVLTRGAQRTGSNNIGAARSRDAGCWPTAASPSQATIKAWSQRGAGIAWPSAKDIRCWGSGKIEY